MVLRKLRAYPGAAEFPRERIRVLLLPARFLQECKQDERQKPFICFQPPIHTKPGKEQLKKTAWCVLLKCAGQAVFSLFLI